jgi:DNA-binding XRE family transcriptional regulator
MVARSDPYEFPAIRAFAAELAAWRGELSKVELAETLGYTPQLIGQLEAGKNIPSRKFAEDVDTYFTTNGLFVRLWKLITETRHLATLPQGFPEFMAREAQASRMYAFEPSVIKGIFQTREYAYEVMKSGRSPDEIEQLVAKRMERQEILSRARPPRVVAVFDEVAIKRQIGGRETMRGQGAVPEIAPYDFGESMSTLAEQWRKSSRSTDTGGNCVEVATWQKSSRSGDTGGQCVEVAVLQPRRAIDLYSK